MTSTSKPIQPKGNPKTSRRHWWLAAFLLLLGLWLIFKDRDGDSDKDRLLIQQVVGSEELILELTPRLDQLSRGMMNLHLPQDDLSEPIFSDVLRVRDLAGAAKGETASGLFNQLSFPIEKNLEATASGKPSLWRALLDQISYFEHTSFRFVRGEFLEGGFHEFHGDVIFKGLGRTTDGMWLGLSGKIGLDWRLDSDGWRITIFDTKKLEATAGERRLFSESLDAALPNSTDRLRARRSIHQEETVKYYQSMKTLARSYDFSPTAMNQKPAVTVGDVDGDGFDDIYVMVRLGKNLLLRNRGDGTFEERADQFDIAVEGNTTCSLFADFDNDGDQDLLLGRALERCVYFENTGAWFQMVEQPIELPSLAVSMAAADYNGDGLLDVYVATYRPGDIGTGLGIESGGSGKTWPERFLSKEEAEEFRRRFDHSRSGAVPHRGFLNQIGPPNRLLMNIGGGKFEPAPETDSLALWTNSLQASWGDYDNDGDADLYIANDWAPDNLFRNDGEKGFHDVTTVAGTDVFGFAMGASWGDYDNDGKQDLYVSNMYSKAGRRIMAQVGGLDSKMLISAEGNYLYRQGADGRFEHVSGLEKPKLLVADSGWSWGGQFADFDNDTDLDIYALSGYFTAPEAVASKVDL
jgi:hypothetical protein